MKYYVTTDIHGYYRYLQEALTSAGFFEETEPCKLIVCGDMLDRGGEACRLTEFMIDLLHEDKLIYIRGNHEDMMMKCLLRISEGKAPEIASGKSVHYTNGTWGTLLQLSGMSADDAVARPDELIERVKASDYYRILLPETIDYLETENYIFVHGWIPSVTEGVKPDFTYYYDKNWRDADEAYWQKARWLNGMELACRHGVTEQGKTIVCGHKRASLGHSIFHGKGTESGEGAIYTPFYDDGIICVDSSAVRSGMLNCIVIEDQEVL